MTKSTVVNIDQYDCMEETRNPQDAEEDMLCVTVLLPWRRGLCHPDQIHVTGKHGQLNW